jgi:hypothetical protein
MDMPEISVPQNAPVNFEAFDDLPASSLSPLDPTDSFNLHRAINERRAQVENAELLKHLRSL